MLVYFESVVLVFIVRFLFAFSVVKSCLHVCCDI